MIFNDISSTHSRLAKCTTKHQGEQEMFKMALNKFSLPGEANFPLNDHFHRPASPEDTDELRRYMMQFRYAASQLPAFVYHIPFSIYAECQQRF